MLNFGSILFVPLAKRDNRAAIRRVADLAARNDADLTVMGVVAEPTQMQRLLDKPRLDEAIREAEQRDLVAKLDQCITLLGHHRTKQVVRTGKTPLVVVREVLRSGHDLVVVTSDEDREDHATIKRLLRACPCPVWVIRSTRAKTQRVLAAVDIDPDESGLNQRILALAATMTELYGGELHVVHAWRVAGEDTLRNSAFIHQSPKETDRLVAAERLRHQRSLDELLAGAGAGQAWIPHLEKGSAAAVVADVVARKRINLVVMGTVARSGLAGLLVGNTAEQLLDDIRCSMIAVKPPDFVSPVAIPDGLSAESP